MPAWSHRGSTSFRPLCRALLRIPHSFQPGLNLQRNINPVMCSLSLLLALDFCRMRGLEASRLERQAPTACHPWQVQNKRLTSAPARPRKPKIFCSNFALFLHSSAIRSQHCSIIHPRRRNEAEAEDTAARQTIEVIFSSQALDTNVSS